MVARPGATERASERSDIFTLGYMYIRHCGHGKRDGRRRGQELFESGYYFFETIYRQTQLSRDTNRPNRAMINHCIVFCAVIPICHPIRTNHHTGPGTKKKPPWENRNRSVHRYYRHWKLNFNLPV